MAEARPLPAAAIEATPPLAGRTALVTGGGTGVGAAIARALSAAGADLVLLGRRAGPLEETAATLPGRPARTVTADVTREDQLTVALEGLGPLDIVIANAGAADSRPFARTGLAEWQAMIDVNLTGAFLTARATLPAMATRGWGRLVFVASTAGLRGYPYVAAYVAAKHGVVGLARALAQEVARKGVTVNALCPGFVETPMLERSVATITAKTGRTADQARAELAADNPMGRFVQPEEVAHLALSLCLPGSDSLTGQAIAIAGGEL